MGSLRNIDFGELGQFRERTGFRKPVPARFRVPEIPFPRFRQFICILKEHLHFCSLKLYSPTSKVYFCTLEGY